MPSHSKHHASTPGSSLARRRRVAIKRRVRKSIFVPAIQHLESRVVLSTDFWTGHSANTGGDNNWSNPGNWSLNAVPGASDVANFTSAMSQWGSAVVDVAESPGSLVIDSTWNGTLTVNSTLTVSGNFTLSSGTVNGPGTFTAAGIASQVTSATLATNFKNTGTLTITGTNDFHLAGTLTNTGTIVDAAAQLIRADAPNTTINNQAGAFFDFQAAANLYFNGNANCVFNNAGTLERTAGSGTAQTSFSVNNTGAGAIVCNSGTLQLTAGGTGGGNDQITAANGAVVSLAGNFSGTFNGSGTGAVQLANFVGTGGGATLNFAGGVLKLTDSISGLVTNAGTLTFVGTNDLHISGTLTNTGTVIDAAPQLIRANAPNTTINNQAGAFFDFKDAAYLYDNGNANCVFNNAGTLERTAGSGIAKTSFSVNNSGTIAGNSGTLQFIGGGTGGGNDQITAANSGIVSLAGNFSGTFAGSGSGSGAVQLTNFIGTGSGATLNFSGGVLKLTDTVGGLVTNAGTLTFVGTNDLHIGGTLTNTGTIIDAAAHLIRASAPNTTINNQAGAFFDFQDAAYLYDNGQANTVFNNAGTLERTAGAGIAKTTFSVNNTGTIAGNSGTLQLNGGGSGAGNDQITAANSGTVSLAGNFSGTFAGSGTGSGAVQLSNFVGTGGGATLNFTGGVLQLTDTVGGLVTNSGTMTLVGTNDLKIGGTLTNTGTIIDAAAQLIRANAPNTTINNQAGAIFDFQDAAYLYDNGQANAVFNNAGTLERTAGGGIAKTTFVVNNTGAIAGNSGILQLNAGGTGGGNDTITAANGVVSLAGNFSGTFAGSGTGSGAVQLSNFVGTGGGATLNFAGGVLRLTDTIGGLVANAGTMTLVGTNDLKIGGTLTNTGTIIDVAPQLIRANAPNTTINNQAGAVFNFQAADYLYDNGQSSPVFNNAGVLELSGNSAAAKTTFFVNNTGRIACTSGTLQLNAGAAGSGSDVIDPSPGATVILTGNLSGFFGGSGSATGAVQLANVTGAGSGVTFDFNGAVLQAVSGQLAGAITNAGSMTLAGGNGLFLAGTLTNSGAIVATSSQLIRASADGATINNAAGSTFELRAGVTLGTQGHTASFNNSGTLTVPGGAAAAEIGFTMAGSGNMVVAAGTFLADAGVLKFDGSAYLNVAPSASVTIGGNLTGGTQNSGQFTPAGAVLFNGAGSAQNPQRLEVMGQDLGNIAAGFQKNFAYGTLSLGNNTRLQLIDASQNVASAGSKADSLYVNSLVVPPGCTLDLNGFHLYARQTHINGTLLGGAVSTLPTGGAIILNTPTPGAITNASQIDDWTFYGLAGQTVAVIVNTGSAGLLNPLQPSLNFARVQVVAPNGQVVSSGTNSASGADVSLTSISIAANGVYHVLVQAPSNPPGATGNYLVTEWDSYTHANWLNLNDTQNGQLNSPFTSDAWSFSALANEPVKFNLLQTTSPAIQFSLTGPNGYAAFSNQSASSGVIVLPSAGTYTLTAHLSADQPGAYAFNVNVAGQTDLTVGTPFQGTLAGNGQEQLFAVTIANPAALNIVLTDANAQDQNDVYVYAGQAPTQVAYQFRSNGVGANQTVAFPAQPATYYILVYNSVVASPGGHYTLSVQAPAFAWTGFTPGKVSRDEVATLLVTGVFPEAYQSPTAYQIQFIAADNSVFPSTPLYLSPTSLGFQPRGELTTSNAPPPLSATLPANTLPNGTYSVRIKDALGNTQTMAGALTATSGGAGILSTKLIVPNPIGYHQPSTVFVEYTNTGTAPMPAPLLALTATQNNQQGAFLTLDPSLAGLGYVSDVTPAGFSQTVQFVASGAIAGILEPGETVTVPIYNGGWLHSQWDFSRPPITFSLGALEVDNPTPIDWTSLTDGLRPSFIDTTSWNVIAPILTTNLGSTWGQFLQTLDDDAVYLAGLGSPANDMSQLLSFEIARADAAYSAPIAASAVADALPAPGIDLTFEQSFNLSISGRYAKSILGQGWTTNWDDSASTTPNGDAVIVIGGRSSYFSLRPDGGYASQPGDEGMQLTKSGGAYGLVATNGRIYQFNASGALNYVQEVHGNRITAGYNAQGRLATLRHSNGGSLNLAYNAQGLLSTLTDSAGQVESYAYDSGGRLVSFADASGVTSYSYVGGSNGARTNALSQITFQDGAHEFFNYDAQGRLTDEHGDNNLNQTTWTYLSPGGFTSTNAVGAQSTLYFDAFGNVAKTVDPLGAVSRLFYDANGNVTKSIGPNGATETSSYDANGNLTSRTNALGFTTTFAYNATNNLTSYTDAKGNTTRYDYDGQNDLLAITYPNGAQEHASYNPLGEATQYVDANGKAIASTYNAQGRLASQTFSDGSSFTYTFDPRGKLLTATDASGTITFTYGDSSRPYLLTKVAYPDGKFLQFTYDSVGRRTKSVDQLGFTVNYAYDSAGRLFRLTDAGGNLIVQYAYNAAGYLSQQDMGNGTRTIYTYNADGDLSTITNLAPDHVTVNSFDQYSYDAIGNVTTDTNRDGAWQYGYDAAGQLLTAVFTPNASNPDHLTAQNLQYAYDAVGNRVSATINGVTTSYSVNNVNEYTSSTNSGVATSYLYDAEGNLVTQLGPGGATSFTYDGRGALTGINGPNTSASYGYNVLGARVTQTVNGVTTRFEYDPGMDAVAAAFDGGGALTSHFTYGFGLVSQVSAAGAAAYYDFDNIGSTIGLTGANGQYVNQYSYLPFGLKTTISAAISNPFTYVGQDGVLDDGAGLLQMGSRNYSPSTGQFVSNDPLGLMGGDANIRRYVFNNPVQNSDPSGLGQFGMRPLDGNSRIYRPLGQFGEENDLTVGHAQYFYDDDTTTHRHNIGKSREVAARYLLDDYGEYQYKDGKRILDTTSTGKADAIRDDDRTQYQMDSQHYIDRFMRQAVHNTPMGDFGHLGELPLGNNCQRWRYDLIAEYWRLVREEEDRLLALKVAKDDTTTTGVTSEDPNEMVGPAGFGPSNFVAAGALLPYKIEFENDASATSPAQRVDLADQLDPRLDWTTLQLTALAFGATYITIPAGLRHYQTTVSTAQNGQAYVVRVDLNLNAATGLLSATFKTIDPETGLPPANLLTGFLPPEDGSGRGIGYVTFTINPKPGLATGAQIRNVADISFDLAQIISTDQVNDADPSMGIDPNKQALITIDATPPTSSVSALPTVTNSTAVPLSWSGADGAGAGIAGYNIYVSDNGGTFTLFQTNTTSTSANFTGQFGHTYGFYSVATDNLGDVQPTPSGAQASTTIAGPPTSTVTPLPHSTPIASFTVGWSGTPGPGATSIASCSVFVADNGGPFTAFKTATTATTATFTGQLAHTYGFYSVATDNLGGVQATPSGAQATITVVGLPTSSVSPLPPKSQSPSFLVSWSGTPGPGATSIVSFQIFVSDNGGAFTPFLAHTTANSAAFTGQRGHIYGFYSVASDNFGDAELATGAAQATTSVSKVLTAGDFDGDGKTDSAIYDQTKSQFFVLFSGGGAKTPQFGNPADVNIPIAGDFDGDAKADTAIYDQTQSKFFVLLSGGGAKTPQFGNPADVNIPIAGDFDGDGKTDTAIYDQSKSQFFVLLSGGGAKTPQFGNPADVNVPVAGDFDGDGKADTAIYDQSKSQFFILLSGGGAKTPQFGNPAHVNVPVAGDFDGDAKADTAIYDQTSSQFFVLLSGGGAKTPQFGNPAHINAPVGGDFDGDGRIDTAIYDQTNSQFFVLLSGGGAKTPQFGNPADVNVPLPSVYLPHAQFRAPDRSRVAGVASFDFAQSASDLARRSIAPAPPALNSAALAGSTASTGAAHVERRNPAANSQEPRQRARQIALVEHQARVGSRRMNSPQRRTPTAQRP
jgi:RHS repeat-associated protein